MSRPAAPRREDKADKGAANLLMMVFTFVTEFI